MTMAVSQCHNALYFTSDLKVAWKFTWMCYYSINWYCDCSVEGLSWGFITAVFVLQGRGFYGGKRNCFEIMTDCFPLFEYLTLGWLVGSIILDVCWGHLFVYDDNFFLFYNNFFHNYWFFLLFQSFWFSLHFYYSHSTFTTSHTTP